MAFRWQVENAYVDDLALYVGQMEAHYDPVTGGGPGQADLGFAQTLALQANQSLVIYGRSSELVRTMGNAANGGKQIQLPPATNIVLTRDLNIVDFPSVGYLSSGALLGSARVPYWAARN